MASFMDLPLCARVSLTWDIHCDDGRCAGAGAGAGASFGAGAGFEAGFLKLDTVLLMGASNATSWGVISFPERVTACMTDAVTEVLS